MHEQAVTCTTARASASFEELPEPLANSWLPRTSRHSSVGSPGSRGARSAAVHPSSSRPP